MLRRAFLVVLCTAASVRASDKYATKSIALATPDVAKVRDELVSYFELKVTRMNATSVVPSDELTADLVKAMEKTTAISIDYAPGAEDNVDVQPVNNVALAMIQGEVVSYLNEAVGHMNSTSLLPATTLVHDLLDAISDHTGIPATAVELTPLDIAPSSVLALGWLGGKGEAQTLPAHVGRQHAQAPLSALAAAFCVGAAATLSIFAAVTRLRRRVESGVVEAAGLLVPKAGRQTEQYTAV